MAKAGKRLDAANPVNYNSAADVMACSGGASDGQDAFVGGRENAIAPKLICAHFAVATADICQKHGNFSPKRGWSVEAITRLEAVGPIHSRNWPRPPRTTIPTRQINANKVVPKEMGQIYMPARNTKVFWSGIERWNELNEWHF
jgi:hypothetical protein